MNVIGRKSNLKLFEKLDKQIKSQYIIHVTHDKNYVGVKVCCRFVLNENSLDVNKSNQRKTTQNTADHSINIELQFL